MDQQGHTKAGAQVTVDQKRWGHVETQRWGCTLPHGAARMSGDARGSTGPRGDAQGRGVAVAASPLQLSAHVAYKEPKLILIFL